MRDLGSPKLIDLRVSRAPCRKMLASFARSCENAYFFAIGGSPLPTQKTRLHHVGRCTGKILRIKEVSFIRLDSRGLYGTPNEGGLGRDEND